MVSTRSSSRAQAAGTLPSKAQTPKIPLPGTIAETPAILPPKTPSKAATLLPNKGLTRKVATVTSKTVPRKADDLPANPPAQTTTTLPTTAPTRIANSVILPPPRPFSQVPPTIISQPKALPKKTKTTPKTIAKKAPIKKLSATKSHLQDKTNTSPQVKKPGHKPKSIIRKPSPDAQSPRSQCVANGPNGPKVYDKLGFELSYDKCAEVGVVRRQMKGARYYAMLDREDEEERRKGEIMGTKKEKVSAVTYMAWDDRVARELGIPYLEVEMKHYEELARTGFEGKEGEFEAVNMSEDEMNRLSDLCTGSSFRA
ncbi:hypothetical protein BKA65DRAFT_27942 [Rhexocercosporidium sp. MPI-PUGE-AT-0058]|nr:hypothetical protein BKA65DRAFT_27942 [Rhexocercosporidium sp. MPI-PUGE-AT-0058]